MKEAHFEKHSSGIIPKSGNIAERVVKEGITHVLTKMGIMGIRLKIAIKGAVPSEFELKTNFKDNSPIESSKLTNGDTDVQHTDNVQTPKILRRMLKKYRLEKKGLNNDMARNRIKTLRDFNDTDLKEKLEDLKVDLLNCVQKVLKVH